MDRGPKAPNSIELETIKPLVPAQWEELRAILGPFETGCSVEASSNQHPIAYGDYRLDLAVARSKRERELSLERVRALPFTVRAEALAPAPERERGPGLRPRQDLRPRPWGPRPKAVSPRAFVPPPSSPLIDKGDNANLPAPRHLGGRPPAGWQRGWLVRLRPGLLRAGPLAACFTEREPRLRRRSGGSGRRRSAATPARPRRRA